MRMSKGSEVWSSSDNERVIGAQRAPSRPEATTVTAISSRWLGIAIWESIETRIASECEGDAHALMSATTNTPSDLFTAT